MKPSRGQVSVEYLAAALIILLVFVIVLLFIEQTNYSSRVAQQNAQEVAVCTKVASIITYMSSNPPYSETQFQVTRDLNVVNNHVFVGDYFCPFLGKAANVELYAGLVLAFDINGTVLFTNDANYSPFNPSSGPPSPDVDQSGDTILLIDDQGQTWNEEVQSDDAVYAVSADDAFVDPDWVEFRFSNLGLTAANQPTEVYVLIAHRESYLVGLGGDKSMVQCHDGSAWTDIGEYTPGFTELYYYSPNIVSCLSDWNKVNHARIRMTYEPSGAGQTISIDYGRIDANYTQDGIPIDLWDMFLDRPAPVDFQTDLNSTANTFGPGLGNDGWDWQPFAYGGVSPSSVHFNADPNVDGSTSDSLVPSAHRAEIKLGGGVSGSL
ncbi:MAG: hypothetical protein AABY11_02755, partial [archaeon]